MSCSNIKQLKKIKIFFQFVIIYQAETREFAVIFYEK